MSNILILLLGGNPLPNFVTTSYLLDTNRQDVSYLPMPDLICVVCSSETEPFYSKLESKLKETHSNSASLRFEKIELNNDHRKPEVIYTRIKEKIEEISRQVSGKKFSSIHLNYTGGTKPMSVNAYRAVNDDKIFSLAEKVIISDLDPDNFKLLTMEDGKLFPLSDGDLRGRVKISIEDIFFIHNKRIKTKGDDLIQCIQNKSDFSSLLYIPEDLLNINAFAKDYIKNFKSNKDSIKNLENFVGNSNSISKDEVLKDFHSLDTLFKDYMEENRKKLNTIIGGKWLEDYILSVLKKMRECGKIQEITEIRKSVEPKNKGTNSELDIVLIRGYQLFLISCTAAEKIKTVKQKAFEALFRTEQLAGEHAKIIIVSLLPNNCRNGTKDSNKKNLKKDIEEFRASKYCELIGIDDISEELSGNSCLMNKLTNFINGGG